MAAGVRTTVLRAVSRARVYRLLPPGTSRDYAAIRYLSHRGTAEDLCRYVERSGRVPAKHASAATEVGAAAFATGRDALAQNVVTEAVGRFPDVAGLHTLQADLDAFHGDYDAAASHAAAAWLLDPTSEHAATKAVRYGYFAGDIQRADHDAVVAVRRFHQSPTVLWAAAIGCQDADQFARLSQTWEDAAAHEHELRAGIRPLAMAAERAGRLDAAVEICAAGILLRLDGVGSGSSVKPRRLQGRGPWAAIKDTVDALQGAGIPFFFAAGTVLGLIRDGRPLGHDSDIDVGVFELDWDRGALIKAFARHPMFVPDEVHPRSEKIALRHRGGSPIDIFRFYAEDGGIWHSGTFVRWRNSPFEIQPRTIGGIAVPLPKDDDRYLTENYGDWRTPDTDFDAFTDAPNVEVVWPEYLDYHLIRRAYARLTASNVPGALGDIARASDRLGASKSGRRVLEALQL